jgi:hypothetical protein
VTIIALDLSKRSTGYAIWQPETERPFYGSVQLGSEFTSDGRCCLKLHRVLADLHKVHKFDRLYFEKPLTQIERGGNSNAGNDIQLKLVGHAESFGEAFRLRTIMGVNISSWRKFFVGRMPRGTKSKDWKAYADERCRQYGWSPRTTDEADALGLLDYCCELQGIIPPWRRHEVLRPALTGAA